MALSNWDTLALNEKAEDTNGEISNKIGSVAIYKNWLYVRSENMWCEGGGYIEPTIAEVQSGEIIIAGFKIESARHEYQNSIFCLVSPDYEFSEFMAGIGCYAYTDGGEFTGVTQETVETFFEWLENETSLNNKEWLKKAKNAELKRFNQGDKYFQKHLNLPDVKTKVGENKGTIMEEITKSWSSNLETKLE